MNQHAAERYKSVSLLREQKWVQKGSDNRTLSQLPVCSLKLGGSLFGLVYAIVTFVFGALSLWSVSHSDNLVILEHVVPAR